MNEEIEGNAGHASKHVRSKSMRVDAGKAEIHFAPEVISRFADLEKAIRKNSPVGDEHFTNEMLKNLHTWATKGKGPIDLAIADMLDLGSETMQYVQATGNTAVKDAFDALTSEVMEHMQFTAKDPALGVVTVQRQKIL